VQRMKPSQTLVALVLAVGASADASAATAFRQKIGNAASGCQAALPVFEGRIRKSPLAIQNAGTERAFLTCSFVTDNNISGSIGTKVFGVYVINNGVGTATIHCTGVIGQAVADSPRYITKNVSIAPGATRFLQWDERDNGGVYFPASEPVSVSCNLPAGTGISLTYVDYDVNIGT
jgi:hypothetical protein